MPGQRFTFNIERTLRSNAVVSIDVTERELDELTYSQLEKKAIDLVAHRWQLGEPTYSCSVVSRRAID